MTAETTTNTETVEIHDRQVWTDNRFGIRYKVWDFADGIVELTGPNGSGLEISTDDLRASYTLEVN
jgi:hypothetical protein